jgi:hypothetical protein
MSTIIGRTREAEKLMSIFLRAPVSYYSLKYGLHSGVFQRVVTLDRLFEH